MGFYEAAEDEAQVARTAENVEFYQKILDIQPQSLEE